MLSSPKGKRRTTCQFLVDFGAANAVAGTATWTGSGIDSSPGGCQNPERRGNARRLKCPKSAFCDIIALMETTTTPAHAENFMNRVLDPLAHSLNPEAAKSILATTIDAETQARVQDLAERANEGELTPEERDEYLSYVESADLLAIFRRKDGKDRHCDVSRFSQGERHELWLNR